MYLWVMYKSSAFCVGRLVTSCYILQALNYSLCDRKVRLYTFATSISLLANKCAYIKCVVLTVFPAPFWPVMSVSGIPNCMMAFSESSEPKLRIPVAM